MLKMSREKLKDYYINSYLERVPDSIKRSWSTEYYREIEEMIRLIMPKPSPKIVDIRININLIVAKFYIVLLMGPDQRSKQRKHIPQGFSRIGNWFAGILILIILNLAISVVIFMTAYYIKCNLGINIFKNEHLIDKFHQFF
jgi:ABC-type spermidine/putrescine transport system permease subunit I